jgi:hypothetical protein
LKKRIENIISLIEGWYNKKLVFTRQCLPFVTVEETIENCAYLQIAEAIALTKIC